MWHMHLLYMLLDEARLVYSNEVVPFFKLYYCLWKLECTCWYKVKIKGKAAVIFTKRETVQYLHVCACVCSASHKPKWECLWVWGCNWGTDTDCSRAQGDTEMEKGLRHSHLMPIWQDLHLAGVFCSPVGAMCKVNTVPFYMSCPLCASLSCLEWLADTHSEH